MLTISANKFCMTTSVPLGTPAFCIDPAFCSCAPSRADGIVSTVAESMVCCVSSRSTGPDRVPRSDVDDI